MAQLIDDVRGAIRERGMSYRTEQSYCDWVYRYIVFHGKRHPVELREKEADAFLTFLATERCASRSTQQQARQAILFLYRHVLNSPLGSLSFIPTIRPQPIPDILSRNEVSSLMEYVQGTALLQIGLLYGCGLRLIECLQLRVQDVDIERRAITVRDRMGKKERVIPLSERLVPALGKRLQSLRRFYTSFGNAFCGVSLPGGIEGKCPAAAFEWQWFFLFPAQKPSCDFRTGEIKLHHRHESSLQKAVRQAAVKAGISKKVSCHTFRHSYAIHLLESGCDIRTLQALLGHNSVRNTMVYTRVLKAAKPSFANPLDILPIGDKLAFTL